MIRRPLSFIACLFLITLIMLLKLHPIRGNPPDIPEGKIVTLSGRLKDRQKKNGSFTLILSDTTLSDHSLLNTSIPDRRSPDQKNPPYRPSVLIYLDSTETSLSELPPLGSSVSVKGKFSLFEKATNPGQFDPEEYYHIRGIEYMLFNARILSRGEKYDLIKESLFRFRLKLSGVYDDLLSPEESGILCCMILGDRSGLDPGIKNLYQESGIAHALSISSLHISILGYGLYKLLKKLCCNRMIPAVSCTLFVLLYSLMVGGSTSTVRAVIMFSTCMASDLTGRTYDILSAVSLSLMMILFSDPLYIYDPGFTLSFGSVLGIALLSPVLKDVLPFGKRRSFSGAIACISVSLAILPINLYFFYEVPVFSFFLNLLVVPLMGVLVVSALLTALIGAVILPAAVPGAFLCHLILSVYEKGCFFIQSLPGNRLTAGRPESLRIAAYYLLLLLFCLIRKRKKALIILPLLPLVVAFRLHGGITYTMLDIGQGDCNVLDIGGKVMVIDCGSTSVKEIGKYRVIPFLKFSGRNRIDLAVVTHSDLDHISGFTEIMEGGDENGIRIKNLIMPGIRNQDEKYRSFLQKARDKGIRVSFINAGESFSVNNMAFSCLGPEKGFETGDANEYSTVLKGSLGSLTLLFTGDIQGEGERRMIRHLDGEERITVLKTAHHGSRFSTPEEFLNKTNPRFSLISAGRRNRYSHPHEELLRRLKDKGSEVHITKNEGAITVKSDGKSISVRGFLGIKRENPSGSS